MSRCFPFPPPGYEKKFTTDESKFLKKEKRKEKKHKKDKKDKEKKDKHRDKKKDKEKSKSDEKQIHEQFGAINKNQLQNVNEQKKETSSITDDTNSFICCPDQNGDSVRNRIKPRGAEKDKFVQELDRRIKEEEKGTVGHQFDVDVRKNNVNGIDGENMVFGNRINSATFPLFDNKIDRRVDQKRKMQEKGNRIDTDVRQSVIDAAGLHNMVFPNRINSATPVPFDNKIDRRVDQQQKMQEKGSDDKRGDKRKKRDRYKDMEKKKKKEKSEQKKAERDKNKQIKNNEFVDMPYKLSTCLLENSVYGVGSEGNLKKRRDTETNGGSHENELRPNKMARPISNIPQENGRKLDFPQRPSLTLLDKQWASLNSSKAGSTGGQRVNDPIAARPILLPAKEAPITSFNHIASKPSPIKSPPVITNNVAAQSPPPIPTIKTQPNHIAAQIPVPKPPPPTTTAKQPSFGLKSPPNVVNKVAVPPQLPIPKKKSPHPDTKYLNQLSVPKLDEWCGFDEQEWLFSNIMGRPVSKKPTMEELQVQVWSEAKHIEFVDVCALPYVIPY